MKNRRYDGSWDIVACASISVADTQQSEELIGIGRAVRISLIQCSPSIAGAAIRSGWVLGDPTAAVKCLYMDDHRNQQEFAILHSQMLLGNHRKHLGARIFT